MKIFLKTEDEIDLMRKANQLVGSTLAELGRHVQPGITTLQLDKIAEEFIRDHGAIPTFKNFPNPYGEPFPASICTSVNDVVVHGIPNADVVLKEGDIISIDCGALLDGYNGDSCYTFAVGEVSPEVRKLLDVTKESLYRGIEQAVAGRHVIEPMITMGDYHIGMLPDKWSIVTCDRKPAAHFEHTIAIRKGKAEILSTFEEIENH